MKYGSICSGIEAATVAWHGLGWQPQWFSEIEKYPSQVLAHHYPGVPNLGDMTKFDQWGLKHDSINLLVGGTPCQSFSVAGLRKGLDDPRGNLMLTYLAIAESARPKWLVWENVPGVLSSNGGRDFGTFLGALAELGYGWAYRVLDAQYFGVAQRRRRVFVVGYLGDATRAGAVLFERESLSRNPAPSREKREEVAGTLASRTGAGGFPGTDEALSGYVRPCWWDGGQVSQTLDAVLQKGQTMPEKNRFPAVLTPIPILEPGARTGKSTTDKRVGIGVGEAGDHVFTLQAGKQHGVFTVHGTQDPDIRVNQAHTLGRNSGQENAVYGIPGNWIGRKPENGGNAVEPMHDIAPCQTKTDKHGVAHGMRVRRLTPTECERLQGFPDGYTDIRPNGKDTPDGPRYKALGNSMAVPVMRWIGERIQQVENINA